MNMFFLVWAINIFQTLGKKVFYCKCSSLDDLFKTQLEKDLILFYENWLN
jgi:hypothetical protein